MTFRVPPNTLAYWVKRPPIRVTKSDIEMLEARLELKAPQSYVDFIETYGAVEFDYRIDCRFAYFYEDSRHQERRTEAISFVKAPANALQYYDGLRRQAGRVNIPPHLLPFAMDYGEGELLIEFGQATERIFYWNFDTHDWESGVTRIGFVANNMYDFISNLRPFDDQ